MTNQIDILRRSIEAYHNRRDEEFNFLYEQYKESIRRENLLANTILKEILIFKKHHRKSCECKKKCNKHFNSETGYVYRNIERIIKEHIYERQ